MEAIPTLPERFSIVRKLGEGGMGVVFEATDHVQGGRVALKTLARMHPVALLRFKHEFRALATLAHRNLIPLYELISDGTTWFFTMELVEGVGFLDFVRPGGTRTDVTRLRGALHQLALGVTRLHASGVLHRDLKPSNVLVSADGHLTILDFGLVKEIAEPPPHDAELTAFTSEHTNPRELALLASLTAYDRVVGSVPYMAPEQAMHAPLTEAADWYAVGVMLYEALAGRRPFTGSSSELLLAKLTDDVPTLEAETLDNAEDLANLCMALLRREPLRRPSGAEIIATVARSRSHAAHAVRSTRAVPFVGRREQLDQLDAAFDAMHDGQAVIVHVRGPSGAGKSTLVQHFLTRLEKRLPVVVLAGRCYEQESVPYKALDQVIDALCRFLAALPSSEARLYLPRDVVFLARVFPVLAQVAAIREAMSDHPAVPDVQEVRRRAFRALGGVLRRLGDRHNVVLSIDDLQWGDVDSAALLRDLLGGPDPPRILLVASYRSEYTETSPCLVALNAALGEQHATVEWRVIEVGALSLEESRQLASLLLGSGEWPDEQSNWLARESGGNAYFVHELAAHARGSGLPAAALSVDLDEVLWARVRQLPTAALRLLQVVAVAGQPVPLRITFDAAQLAGEAQQALGVLRAEHFVRSTGSGLDDQLETFHDRIRETVTRRLGPELRSSHHLRLAHSLDASAAADPETVARHFHQGGDLHAAGRTYVFAGDRAAAALAFGRSAELYGLALTVSPPPGEEGRALRVKLADALANAGRGVEAARAYLAACGSAGPREQRELRRRAGFQFCISGSIDEGREAFREVLATEGLRLPATKRRALLSLLLHRLHLMARGIRFRERDALSIPREALDRIDLTWSVAGGLTMMDTIRGADFQTRNLIDALRTGEPYRITRALAWEGAHLAMSTSLLRRHAERLLAAAADLARRLDVPHASGMVEMSYGVANFFWGNPVECRRRCLAAVTIFQEHCTGVAWELDTCHAFGFWALYFQGKWSELARELETLVADARRRGARLAEADVITFGGPFAWLARDDPEGAQRAVLEATQQWAGNDFQVQHWTTLTAEAQIALYRGDGVAAWDIIIDRWDGVRGSMLLHVEVIWVYALDLRARCALAASRTPGHERLLKAAEKFTRDLERARPEYARALGRMFRGALAARAGDRATAISVLREAAPELNRLGWGAHGSAAQRHLGELIGGEEGAALVTAVDAAMRADGIRNPERFARVHLPRV